MLNGIVYSQTSELEFSLKRYMYHFHSFSKSFLLTKLMSAPSVVMLPYFRTLDRHSHIIDLFSSESFLIAFHRTHSVDRTSDQKKTLRTFYKTDFS